MANLRMTLVVKVGGEVSEEQAAGIAAEAAEVLVEQFEQVEEARALDCTVVE